MSISTVVICVTSFLSFDTGLEQKEHPFSPGGGLLPSLGRFPLKDVHFV